jgi:hypothetical protein
MALDIEMVRQERPERLSAEEVGSAPARIQIGMGRAPELIYVRDDDTGDYVREDS